MLNFIALKNAKNSKLFPTKTFNMFKSDLLNRKFSLFKQIVSISSNSGNKQRIFYNISKQFSITKRNSFSTMDKNKEIEEFFKNYEKNVKEAESIANSLIESINSLNESEIMNNMEKLNNLPLRYSGFEELKSAVLNKFEQIPLQNAKTIINFIQLCDKLEIENFEELFAKIEFKIGKAFEAGKFELKDLAMLIYAYSKYQITDKNIWRSFYSKIIGNVNIFSLETTSQILLAFSMLQTFVESKKIEIFSNEEYGALYKEIFKNIENKINELTYLDTFRICISMTKRPVGIMDVSQNVWRALQQNFKKDITAFDLYQTSQIVLLFCETPYLDLEIFKVVEEELTKEYIEKIDEISKTPDFNTVGLIDDMSKICFSFALSRQGSQFFWNKALQAFIKLEDKMSNIALENILFITYRLIDYLSHLQAVKGVAEPDESMKSLMTLFNKIEERIVKNKLVENNLIDPFNTMMPLSRLGNINSQIWNPLIKNLMNVLNKAKSVNPFLLNDLVFALSNYYMNLILQKDQGSKEDYKNCYYLNNLKNIWTKIEDLIINVDEKTLEAPHLGNIIIDLSSVDLELPRAWAYLTEKVIEKMNEFDANSFVMVLMGISKKDIKNPELWKLLENFVRTHINEFSIEDLRKVMMSFLKHKEVGKDFWSALESKFINNDVMDKINLEYMFDLQIPFAITGIYNDKIWNKFEEIVFRNLKLFENDKDYLMNTIYSFSRSGKGSPILWSKFCSNISKNLNGYDIDDLGHIAVCLKSDYIKKNKLETVLNEAFWAEFTKNVESKMSNAKLNSLNNLIRGIKENDILNKNEKLVKKIESKIVELIRELSK